MIIKEILILIRMITEKKFALIFVIHFLIREQKQITITQT